VSTVRPNFVYPCLAIIGQAPPKGPGLRAPTKVWLA